jgi:hypothetical protein
MESPVSVALVKAATSQSSTEGTTGQLVSYALERKLADYVAALQVDGSFGRQLSTPSALGSEAARLLKTYLEHAAKLQDHTRKRVGPMSDKAEVMVASREESEIASLPAGPASTDLGPVDSLRDHDSAHLVGVSGQDLERAVNLLSEMLSFSFETAFIGTATMNVSRSANTLLHGQ